MRKQLYMRKRLTALIAGGLALAGGRVSWLTSFGNVGILRLARTDNASSSTCRGRAWLAPGYARCSPRSLARGCSRSDPAPATTPSTSRGGLSQTAPWRSWTSSRRCSTTPCAEHTHWASRTSSRRRAMPRRYPTRTVTSTPPTWSPPSARSPTRARVVRAASRTQARRAAGGRGGLARPPQGILRRAPQAGEHHRA